MAARETKKRWKREKMSESYNILIARLDELSKLKDGWYNNDGYQGSKAIHPDVLSRVKQFIKELDDATPINHIYLFPTPEGGINLESKDVWYITDFEVEFHPDGKIALLITKEGMPYFDMITLIKHVIEED